MSEISKTYDPKQTEDKIYKMWLESGFFMPENLSPRQVQSEPAKKFVTCIAPPNITGELHLGHALELTLQDIIVRIKRMQGYQTLWLPGTDHAGIAAQNVVEKQLAREGTSRHQLGREKFLERMWQWREKYGSLILDQLKKLGLSLDWSRVRFTMDPEYQKAVEEAFQHYFRKGWIYQGERVVNWCARCATSISDLEVNYRPEKTKLYFIKYGSFVLATARPETKLGDTALAVHPDDQRYKSYVGKELEIESVNNDLPPGKEPGTKKIKIQVVADWAVDMKFGTGIIKVTPAHDLTDYEIAQRHHLTLLKVIGEDGRMNKNAGRRYQGLTVSQARQKIVADLQTIGLITKIEDYQHNLACCDRCHWVIEPLPSKQWFLKMGELAELAKKAVASGQISLVPERWVGPWNSWLDGIRDWCISRQLWWGHKIPIAGETDVLDTWFSSALWPFAVMGWPASAISLTKTSKTKKISGSKSESDFKKYYPTDLITSGREILYLWIARMVFSGMEFTNQPPFKSVYIHATVLTKDGKRMSKSLGTGIDPLKLIEKYGSDALRFGLASQTTGLQDLKFGEDLMIMGKKFANKLWNISRYVLTKVGAEYDWENAQKVLFKKLTGSAGMIIDKADKTAQIVARKVEKYDFAEAAKTAHQFLWHEFADKYIEESKSLNDDDTQKALAYVLITSLRFLHPFMPFVTEEIYSFVLPPWPGKKLLLVEDWPTPDPRD